MQSIDMYYVFHMRNLLAVAIKRSVGPKDISRAHYICILYKSTEGVYRHLNADVATTLKELTAFVLLVQR
jgi:hypothetical protein